MGKVVAVEYVSLDGVMQAPGRPDEDTRGGFPFGGWAAELLARDPEAAGAAMQSQGDPTAGMLFGRRTYLDLVGHWLGATEPNPFTEVLRTTAKYVASATLTEPLPHPNSFLLGPDVPAEVARLRREPGALVVLGSGALVRSLAAADLVDEYLLTIFPVVLGRGTRLFGDDRADLEVTRTMTSPTGIVVATYRVRRADNPAP